MVIGHKVVVRSVIGRRVAKVAVHPVIGRKAAAGKVEVEGDAFTHVAGSASSAQTRKPSWITSSRRRYGASSLSAPALSRDARQALAPGISEHWQSRSSALAKRD